VSETMIVPRFPDSLMEDLAREIEDMNQSLDRFIERESVRRATRAMQYDYLKHCFGQTGRPSKQKMLKLDGRGTGRGEDSCRPERQNPGVKAARAHGGGHGDGGDVWDVTAAGAHLEPSHTERSRSSSGDKQSNGAELRRHPETTRERRRSWRLAGEDGQRRVIQNEKEKLRKKEARDRRQLQEREDHKQGELWAMMLLWKKLACLRAKMVSRNNGLQLSKYMSRR
jgi:hypothetical protein